MVENIQKVGIQGVLGAFHEIAAKNYFNGQGNIIIHPTDTFDDLVQFVENTPNATAMMAIENTIAGSLLGNYLLLVDAQIEIVGEIYLRIRHNLMALPGQTIDDLEEVHSHPMALAQCKHFLKQYPHLKLVATEDTAKSAESIRKNNWTNVGAIASSLAAEMYGLNILGRGIETNKMNYTRFLVLKKPEVQEIPTYDKASIKFSVSHEVGSLYEAMGTLKHFRANMTKVQSVPLLGSQWKYVFFVDLLIGDPLLFEPMLRVLNESTEGFKLLGKYNSGLYYES